MSSNVGRQGTESSIDFNFSCGNSQYWKEEPLNGFNAFPWANLKAENCFPSCLHTLQLIFLYDFAEKRRGNTSGQWCPVGHMHQFLSAPNMPQKQWQRNLLPKKKKKTGEKERHYLARTKTTGKDKGNDGKQMDQWYFSTQRKLIIKPSKENKKSNSITHQNT